MTPLSDSEAATVARFENAEPAPESWGGGLREVLVDIARAMNPLLHDPLMTKVAEEWVDERILPVVTAYAEQRARERAAEELWAAVLEVVRQHGTASLAAKHLLARAAALAADDRTGQR